MLRLGGAAKARQGDPCGEDERRGESRRGTQEPVRNGRRLRQNVLQN